MNSDLEKKIREKVKEHLKSRPIEQVIDQEIDREISDAIRSEVSNEVKTELTPEKNSGSIREQFAAALTRKPCKRFFLMAIIVQALIFTSLFVCRIPSLNYCLAGSPENFIFYLILISTVILSLSLAFFLYSGQLRPGIICLALLYLPLILFILIVSFRYIGLIIVILVILTVFARQTRY